MGMNFPTKEAFQEAALAILRHFNYHGVVSATTGSGKSVVAIKAIKEGGFKNILITSPRTNLKENWKQELSKWGIIREVSFNKKNNTICFCK